MRIAWAMACERPDKDGTTTVLGNINGFDILRTTGYNGNELIEHTEMPRAVPVRLIGSRPDPAPL